MDSIVQSTQPTPPPNGLKDSDIASLPWHVIWTRSHSEQLVHDQLAQHGLRVFLPTIETWIRRRGMRHHCTVPMFSGYVFLNQRMDPQSYLAVCKVRGVVKLLGESWDRLAVLPENEAKAIRTLHASRLPAKPHPYLDLKTGRGVRVVGGLLAGIEGTFLRSNLNKGLFVISVNLLQRSVAVEIDCTLVVPA